MKQHFASHWFIVPPRGACALRIAHSFAAIIRNRHRRHWRFAIPPPKGSNGSAEVAIPTRRIISELQGGPSRQQQYYIYNFVHMTEAGLKWTEGCPAPFNYYECETFKLIVADLTAPLHPYSGLP